MQFIESCRHLLRFLREIPVEREQLIPSNFTVLDVFVDDKEAPLVRPNVHNGSSPGVKNKRRRTPKLLLKNNSFGVCRGVG